MQRVKTPQGLLGTRLRAVGHRLMTLNSKTFLFTTMEYGGADMVRIPGHVALQSVDEQQIGVTLTCKMTSLIDFISR